jgi:hypothetical protein
MTGWELSAVFASGASILGAALGDRSILSGRAYIAVGVACLVALLMLALRVPLPQLAMLPCLVFASATDIHAHEAPYRMTTGLGVVGGLVAWSWQPTIAFGVLLGAWALLGAAIVLTFSVAGYRRKAVLGLVTTLAIAALWTHSPLLLLLGVCALFGGLLRAEFSETSVGPGDAIPAACLAVALGPIVGATLLLSVAAALVLVALATRWHSPQSAYAPVVPAMLLVFLFHTLTMPLS